MTQHPRPDTVELYAAQRESILAFRRMVEGNVPTLDTETTGLDGSVVWQFALADQRTLTPLLAFTCSAGAAVWTNRAAEMQDAQGITSQAWPSPEVYAPQVAHAAGLAPVAWNAPFDSAAIRRTWPELAGWDAVACAQELYAPLTGEWSERRGAWKSGSLGEACEREGIDVSGLPGAHSAYGDACRLALLIRAVAARELPTAADTLRADGLAQWGEDDLISKGYLGAQETETNSKNYEVLFAPADGSSDKVLGYTKDVREGVSMILLHAKEHGYDLTPWTTYSEHPRSAVIWIEENAEPTSGAYQVTALVDSYRGESLSIDEDRDEEDWLINLERETSRIAYEQGKYES